MLGLVNFKKKRNFHNIVDSNGSPALTIPCIIAQSIILLSLYFWMFSYLNHCLLFACLLFILTSSMIFRSMLVYFVAKIFYKGSPALSIPCIVYPPIFTLFLDVFLIFKLKPLFSSSLYAFHLNL